MAQFDVYRTSHNALVVDCQAEFLSYLKTRFVVPLLPPELEPKIAERLNPVFLIEGSEHVFYPQFAASVPTKDLKDRVVSLSDEYLMIENALDMLITGI